MSSFWGKKWKVCGKWYDIEGPAQMWINDREEKGVRGTKNVKLPARGARRSKRKKEKMC